MKCSICGKEIKGFGNNAWPVNDGTCCDECNVEVVIPMRLCDMDALKTIRELDFETAEEGIAQLRSLCTEGVISKPKYDYIINNFDRLVSIGRQL